MVETPPNLGTKETQLASNWEPFREHNLSQGTPCCIIRKAPTRIPARFSSSWHHYQQDWETSAHERLLFSVFVLFWDVLHCLPCFTHLGASCCSWCAAFMTPKVRQISIWGPSPQFWAGALCAVAFITCRKKVRHTSTLIKARMAYIILYIDKSFHMFLLKNNKLNVFNVNLITCSALSCLNGSLMTGIALGSWNSPCMSMLRNVMKVIHTQPMPDENARKIGHGIPGSSLIEQG